VRRSERLGRDEEMELIRLAQDGDVVARNRIVEAYLPFIAKTCRAYRSGTVDREEYLGTGAIAMMRAIENFDPSHEARLSTYAMPQVRGDVSRAWAQTNWTVRLGSTPRRKRTLNHLQREKEKAGIVAPWPMTSSEIHAMARKLDVSTQDVTDLDAKLSKVDLDEDVFETGEVHLLNPMVGQAPTPHDEACLRDVDARMARSLELAASTLSEKERDIVFSRVFSENPETLETLGLRYEISGERVRQIEEVAIEKLAKAMKAIEPRLVEAAVRADPETQEGHPDRTQRGLRRERARRDLIRDRHAARPAGGGLRPRTRRRRPQGCAGHARRIHGGGRRRSDRDAPP
jgi:RNA polymerase sigma-32 factor